MSINERSGSSRWARYRYLNIHLEQMVSRQYSKGIFRDESRRGRLSRLRRLKKPLMLEYGVPVGHSRHVVRDDTGSRSSPMCPPRLQSEIAMLGWHQADVFKKRLKK